jgi:hypothetical protein
MQFGGTGNFRFPQFHVLDAVKPVAYYSAMNNSL